MCCEQIKLVPLERIPNGDVNVCLEHAQSTGVLASSVQDGAVPGSELVVQVGVAVLSACLMRSRVRSRVRARECVFLCSRSDGSFCVTTFLFVQLSTSGTDLWSLSSVLSAFFVCIQPRGDGSGAYGLLSGSNRLVQGGTWFSEWHASFLLFCLPF